MPSTLPRFVRLPGPQSRFVAIETVIRKFTDVLFPGYAVLAHGAFRVIRDSDIEVEEESEDLVRLFETALKRRRSGSVIRIEFDPAKAASNLIKHKVSFAHAEQALRDPMAVTIDDPDSKGEQRFVTLGMDTVGRVLVVVHTLRGDRVRLISARKASRGELEQYHA